VNYPPVRLAGFAGIQTSRAPAAVDWWFEPLTEREGDSHPHVPALGRIP